MDQFGIKHDDTQSFLRPSTKADVKYRKIKRMKFEDELKLVLDENCPFCFHGTPIWNAEKIIKSGKIKPTRNINADLTTQKYVYVSTINNVWFTIQHHAELLNFKYPAGCIFVVKAKDKKELDSAKEKNVISQVDLSKCPDRLFAIITTPENLDRVKVWLKQSEIKAPAEIVLDYDSFLDFAKENYQSIRDSFEV